MTRRIVLAALVLGVGFWAGAPVRAHADFIRGYLNTLSATLTIDSVSFYSTSGRPVTLASPNWGGAPGQLDSADFAIGEWPDMGAALYSILSGVPQPPYPIATLVRDSWILLSFPPDSSRVKFSLMAAIAEEDTMRHHVPNPVSLDLAPAQPSIVTSATAIEFFTSLPVSLDLTVFNARGARVTTLTAGRFAPGTYSAVWNGSDAGHRPVRNGIYFYQLAADGRALTRKLVVAR